LADPEGYNGDARIITLTDMQQFFAREKYRQSVSSAGYVRLVRRLSAVAVAVVKKTSATKGITQIVHRKVDGQREYDRLLSIVEGRPF